MHAAASAHSKFWWVCKATQSQWGIVRVGRPLPPCVVCMQSRRRRGRQPPQSIKMPILEVWEPEFDVAGLRPPSQCHFADPPKLAVRRRTVAQRWRPGCARSLPTRTSMKPGLTMGPRWWGGGSARLGRPLHQSPSETELTPRPATASIISLQGALVYKAENGAKSARNACVASPPLSPLPPPLQATFRSFRPQDVHGCPSIASIVLLTSVDAHSAITKLRRARRL